MDFIITLEEITNYSFQANSSEFFDPVLINILKFTLSISDIYWRCRIGVS